MGMCHGRGSKVGVKREQNKIPSVLFLCFGASPTVLRGLCSQSGDDPAQLWLGHRVTPVVSSGAKIWDRDLENVLQAPNCELTLSLSLFKPGICETPTRHQLHLPGC